MATVLASDAQLYRLSIRVGEALIAQDRLLSCAESCTGGWVAKSLTDIVGCSHWFERGFVTYTNQAKQDMLGVEAEVLANHGAVSRDVVEAMAAGALAHSRASISLAISGIAGPGGGSDEKPVGLVWFAWAQKRQTGSPEIRSQERIFAGDRELIRRQAVAYALQGVLTILHVPA